MSPKPSDNLAARLLMTCGNEAEKNDATSRHLRRGTRLLKRKCIGVIHKGRKETPNFLLYDSLERGSRVVSGAGAVGFPVQEVGW